MLRRSFISVYKNRARTIIFILLLFVIANLVLSSIAIKNATQEAMDQARISLGPEITLTTDNSELFDFIKEYRETYGTRPSQDIINEMLVPITSDVALGIAQSEYVVDFNFSFNTSGVAVGFLPLSDTGSLDTTNTNKISVLGTYNPLLLDQFGDNGTYFLTDESSSFIGDSNNVIIISESLATANSLNIGDSIALENATTTTQLSFEIVGLFNSEEMLEVQGKNIVENEVFIPLENALLLAGQNPDSSYTITSAKYYLDDPLNIDAFITDSTTSYEELSNGTLTFNDVNYDALTAPLQSVSTFTDIILIVVIAASIIILTLLIVNSLKERKYEIGVLLSLGEAKARISFQYLFEILLIATFAFSLATTTSYSVSNYFGNMLVQSEIADASSTTTTTSGGRGGGILSTPISTNIEYIDQIDVSITITDFIITFSLGIIIIVGSSIIPSVYIMRFQPKKILSSRN